MQYSTCCIENKCDAITQKAKISQINTGQSGAFPTMIEELDDQDKPPHVDMSETCRMNVRPLMMTSILMLTTLKLRRVTMTL
jgi:hypothetical protein